MSHHLLLLKLLIFNVLLSLGDLVLNDLRFLVARLSKDLGEDRFKSLSARIVHFANLHEFSDLLSVELID